MVLEQDGVILMNLKDRFPLGSADFYEINDQREVSNTVPQQDQTPALDSADAGETKSSSRVAVRFTGYRVRPLDPDNFAGSCKDLLDGLVHAGILHGDEWWRIEFTTRQKKVRSYAEEKTLIEIEGWQRKY